MASYLNKEISEWNTTDLCNWLLANKFRGISELCQKYNISGYDLFYINDDILKTELNLKSFHERKVTLKLFTKLTYEHLKLNVINSNGDNVILTLDNNPDTQLGEISDYIGNMFNINPKDILFKDSTKQEVLSPTVKIVQMLILYPKIYKTLNVSNMKDYHQAEEELMESGNGDFQENTNLNNNNNNNYKNKAPNMGLGLGSVESGMGLSGDMEFQDMNMNKKYNDKYNNKNKNNYYRGNKNMENNEMANNRRDYNNQNMNYTYNNNYMKMNKNNNKINNNRNPNDTNDDTFLLKSGIDDNNITEQINNDMNKINLNGSNNNIDFNKHTHKSNYMMENNNEEYQDNRINNNLGRQFKNEERVYREREQNDRERQNFQLQSGTNEMFNEESNLGLLSSGNDDELKFKPSYQINNNNNMDNNNYNRDKKNYNNH